MNKALLFVALVSLCACVAQGPGLPDEVPWARQILLVGNSLTFYNNMPATLQQLLNAGNDRFVVYQSTFADRSLADHVRWIEERKSNMIWPAGREDLAHEVSADVLTDKQWDIVILQDATLNILIPGLRTTVFEPAVVTLAGLARSGGAQTLLFQPYPLGIYPARYCTDITLTGGMTEGNEACTPEFEKSFEELMVLRRVLRNISSDIDAGVVPAGEAFERTAFRHPEIPLYYDKWDQHPSPHGSYLIACLYYNHITGKRSEGLPVYGTLSEKDALKLQKVADSFYHPNQFVRFINRLFLQGNTQRNKS